MNEDNDPFLSEELLDNIRYYIEDNNLLRVSRHLRKVFFDYMRFHHDNYDAEFEDILYDIENLLEFIDLIADHTGHLRDKSK